MNMTFSRKLPIPMEVKELYPLTPAMRETFARRDSEIKAVLSGKDDRLLLIVGPCSADREDSVMAYLSRLSGLAERVRDRLVIVPRVYTNKPRTAGDGYLGLLHQPDPEGKPDLFHGLVASRKLHMRALSELGFSCADEMLYTENYKYFDDLLAYVTVGARSVEDQQHRLTASGAEVPVGMKNPTSGDLSVMLNAVGAAQRAHDFIYRGWAARSTGNPFAHAVLRGCVDQSGAFVPNYRSDDLLHLAALYAERGLANPAVIVDANHANSGKRYEEQPGIVREVMESRRENADIRQLVKGFMIESYLEDGAQKPGEHVFGRSITDPCLGWEKTERLVLDLAELAAR